MGGGGVVASFSKKSNIFCAKIQASVRSQSSPDCFDFREPSMTDTRLRSLPVFPSRDEQMFPTLTAAQIARLASHGHIRRLGARETLMWARETYTPVPVPTTRHLTHT